MATNEPRRVHIQVWAVSPLRRLHTFDFTEILDRELEYEFECIAFSMNSKSLVAVTNTAIYIWPLEAAKPRYRLAWEFRYQHMLMCLAMSPDDRFLAVAMGEEVWVWHLEHTTAAALRVDIPHTTEICRFDADSTRLWIEGGVVDLSAVTGMSDGDAIDGSVSDRHSIRNRHARYQTFSAESWVKGQGILAFRGYTLSQDSIWVIRDNQRLLYLPPEYRPAVPMIIPRRERIAYMGSAVAIGAHNGRLRVLLFQDHLTQGDFRWE